MTQNDILTLARAGFNAQQIAALNSVQATPQTQSNPMGGFQMNPGNPQMGGNVDALNQNISQLMGALQSNSLLMAQQPAAPTADSVLAEIINPPTLVPGNTPAK